MMRLHYFDNAKFILIISVVLGHLLENNGLKDCISLGLFDTVFMYAMPAFVCISGIFTPPRNASLTSIKFWISELSIIETMVIFTLIMKVPVLIAGRMSYEELLSPGYTLWYLLALVWWRLLAFILPVDVLRHKTVLLIMAFLICLGSGFISSGNSLAIARTLYFLPFFMIGFCFSDKRELFVEKVKKIPALCSVTIIIAVIVMNTLLSYNLAPYSSGNISYFLRNENIAYSIFFSILYVSVCVVMSSALLRLIPNRKILISDFGSKSLIIYVYHALILCGLMFAFNHFELPKNLIVALVEFLIVVPILMCITKLGVANSITAPISTRIKKRIKTKI